MINDDARRDSHGLLLYLGFINSRAVMLIIPSNGPHAFASQFQLSLFQSMKLHYYRHTHLTGSWHSHLSSPVPDDLILYRSAAPGHGEKFHQLMISSDRFCINMLQNIFSLARGPLVFSVTLWLCCLTPPAAMASQQVRMVVDEGRLHISASDVVIPNATSLRGLMMQMKALNASLQQEIQMRDQQIADLLNKSRCETAARPAQSP
jgi:hypothetical protein